MSEHSPGKRPRQSQLPAQGASPLTTLTEALATRVLENIANLDPNRVLHGQEVTARAANRRSFPSVDFYGDEPMAGGLPGHRHERPELATVLEGKLNIGIGKRIYEARQGDWLVFAPHVLHGECCLPQRTKYSLLWMTLPAADKGACHMTRYTRRGGYELIASMPPQPMPRQLNQEVHHLFEGPWANLASSRHILVRLVSWSLERCETQKEQPAAAHPSIAEAARVVRSQLQRPPTVVELANRVGLSPNYLSSLFHQQTGRTLRQFMDEVRIDEARRLLAEPQRNVKVVAYHLGFTDPHHFSRVFRRVAGETPSAYRRRVLQSTDI